MFCMKCGREIGEDQVFCEACLEVMAKYPVKPNIAVQLPSRDENTILKKNPKRRAAPSPEEQVKILKKRVRRWMITWLITLLLLAATAYPTYDFFRDMFAVLPGQNYSTFPTTPTTSSTPTTQP